eukprot:TRINITY_DN4487_c0_g1_i1.p1 TRINITY_DN4487_c0_g1~~TRINITY_DN4487_c0_g1_i1.p1  ORF type:complete len:526 (-),score=117.10 TRINITY_DN4487_c0_g1_i1:393-1907(-)
MASEKAGLLEGFNETLKWTFGLVNHQGKYLTCEQFQARVSVGGSSLRKKQVWTLEPQDNGKVAFKNYLNKYLGADKDGKVSGDSDEVDTNNTFDIITQDDGRVAIKSLHGRHLNGTDDKMDCYLLEIKPEALWTIHLAIHPQINLRNVNRRTYAHFVEDVNGKSIKVSEEIPWGSDAMLILEFHDGKYAIRTFNGLYLVKDGTLAEELTDDCLYVLVFREGQVAFKDKDQLFLTAVGITATMQSRNAQITKDELFLLEDSHPQVKFMASTGLYCSIRGGTIEVQAKQDGTKDDEIFQMEAIDRTDMSGNCKWAVRGKNKKYWQLGAGTSNIVCDAVSCSDVKAQFSFEWMGPQVALKADNGHFVLMKRNGQLSATSPEIVEDARFGFEFINRPRLILRCENGFVGQKTASPQLECTRSTYDIFEVHDNKGVYRMRGKEGWWNIQADDTFTTNGANPQDFFFELRAHTRMCIVANNGKYILGESNGNFSATGDKSAVSLKTLWEY